MNKEKRKEQIVRAALSIFAYNGFRETKMAEIAEKAGIGKGTIYEYFKSKEEIFHEAFNLFQQEIDSEVSKRLFGLVDPKEKLIVLINTFFELYLNFADDARIMLHFWSEGIRHEKSKRKPTELMDRGGMKKGGHAKNTKRMNRLEELGRVDAEKAFTKKGKRNLKDSF